VLPAKIERVWLVDTRGVAAERRALPKRLTSGQRHCMYRLGLQAVDQFLKQRGFRPNAGDSSTVFSYEKCQVWLDMVLKTPDNIAYVTSYPGYQHREEVIGKTEDGQERYGVRAKVITLQEVLGSEYLIQVMISTRDGAGTRKPIFIPLSKDLPEPAQYVLRNVLGTIALACEQIPKLREAFVETEIKAAQEQAIDVSAALLVTD